LSSWFAPANSGHRSVHFLADFNSKFHSKLRTKKKKKKQKPSLVCVSARPSSTSARTNTTVVSGWNWTGHWTGLNYSPTPSFRPHFPTYIPTRLPTFLPSFEHLSCESKGDPGFIVLWPLLLRAILQTSPTFRPPSCLRIAFLRYVPTYPLAVGVGALVSVATY
jgi:hypothetical protein